MKINAAAFRHEKEELYWGIGLVVGGLLWLVLIWIVVLLLVFAWFIVLLAALALWFAGARLKANLYGNAVHFNEAQFEEVHRMLQEMANRLNLAQVPDVFVRRGQGALNAAVMKLVFGGTIIELHGEVVDLLLRRNAYKELGMILGHELGHHALGHTNRWKRLLLLPSFLVPYFSFAYSRACELSADRIGMLLVGDGAAARRAIVALAAGSEVLMEKVNLEALAAQEQRLSWYFGLVEEMSSTHPRMTIRLTELTRYESDPMFQSHVQQ